MIGNRSPIVVIASEGSVRREFKTLAELARFVRDRGPALSPHQAIRLGAVAALMASLDQSIQWSRDLDSLSRLVDAYDFATGVPATSRAFGQGLSTVLRELRVLGRRPQRGELAELLRLADGSVTPSDSG
jgi:hypothetical protein